MSQNDLDSHERSDDNKGVEEKTVPVAEAIRYRKRAQQAEKQLAELNEELSQQRQRAETLDKQLAAVQQQQTLHVALAEAGATDMEAAMLLAEARLGADENGDAAAVVEQLRSEKAHLFTASEQSPSPVKTAAVRHRADVRTSLDAAAEKAAHSGSRTDMQEYLRMRRAYV